MSYTPPLPYADEDGTIIQDGRDPGWQIEIREVEDGTQDVELQFTDDMGDVSSLVIAERDRGVAALAMFGADDPVEQPEAAPQITGTFQVIISTSPAHKGDPSPTVQAAMLERLVWHLQHGIPARVIEPNAGYFAVTEVAVSTPPERMKEVRRSFRVKDDSEDGGYYYTRVHRDAKNRADATGNPVEAQRKFLSEWELA
ncbi:hypothetical protein ACMX2H_16030 [Arthrobacter sulfonylureivorans]|uniref:hypothetical protein n=1 Tax=Arthrobacter sulfonylureivorans TaxID=2486855 RepID=UPI0039E6D9C1